MTFYNVPDLPGVPPMLRDPSAAVRAVYQQADALVVDFASAAAGTAFNIANSVTGGNLSQLLTPSNDAGGGSSAESAPVWGIFDADGQQVIFPDTFLGIEYRDGSRISDYPLEQGAFETYNKVDNPFDAVISLACGGDLAKRTDFLATARALRRSLDLLTIVTPEEVFASVNVERYDYRRTERNGVGLIAVNFYFKEIRVNTESEFTNTPDDAPTVEEAQAATTEATSDTARAAVPLDADQVQNPASASAESQGQTQALPATATQAGPAQDAPLTLPPGYTQEEDTGLIIKPDGFVDEEFSIRVGAKALAK